MDKSCAERNWRKLRNGHLIFIGSILTAALLISFPSCAKKNQKVKAENSMPGDFVEISPVQKNHVWYYFTENSFVKSDLPQNSPEVHERPWTESVRIASSGAVPVSQKSDSNEAYALVNRLGMLVFSGQSISLCTDASIFSGVTADSMVFSDESPVFYLYRSAFFNVDYEKSISAAVQKDRPLLVEYDPKAKMLYPLVSYSNLNLSDDQQIAGFFWDGKTWTCSAKKSVDSRVEFTYFTWEPNVPITQLSPALTSSDSFVFKKSSEDQFFSLSQPKSFSSAPSQLKDLVQSIPDEFTFSVVWKSSEGTSPVQYLQQGSGSVPLSANASAGKKYVAAIFSDGTTYIKSSESDDVSAFRLPLLPAGYIYGDFAISGDFLYVAWEQSSFYKTGRSGFLQVNLQSVLSQFD